MASSPQVDLAGNRLFPFGLGKGKVFMIETSKDTLLDTNASRHFPWLWLSAVALTLIYLEQAVALSLPCRMSLRMS